MNFQKIVSVLKYLLTNNIENCSDRKHLIIQLDESPDKLNGIIQITATGSWIKHFSIEKFRCEICDYIQIDINVQFKNSERHTLYKMAFDSVLRQQKYTETKEESLPIEHDLYSLKIDFQISVQQAKSMFPKIKNCVKVLADKYRDVKMSFIGAEIFWKECDHLKKCTTMISHAIDDVMKYSTSLNFHNEVLKLLNVTDKQNATEKIYNALSLMECENKLSK